MVFLATYQFPVYMQHVSHLAYRLDAMGSVDPELKTVEQSKLCENSEKIVN